MVTCHPDRCLGPSCPQQNGCSLAPAPTAGIPGIPASLRGTEQGPAPATLFAANCGTGTSCTLAVAAQYPVCWTIGAYIHGFTLSSPQPPPTKPSSPFHRGGHFKSSKGKGLFRATWHGGGKMRWHAGMADSRDPASFLISSKACQGRSQAVPQATNDTCSQHRQIGDRSQAEQSQC